MFAFITLRVPLRHAGMALLVGGSLCVRAQETPLPLPMVKEYTYCGHPYEEWREDSTAACVAATKVCPLPFANWTARMLVAPGYPGGACTVEFLAADGGVGWTGWWYGTSHVTCSQGTTLRPGLGRDYPLFTSDCLPKMSVPLASDPPRSCPADPRVANPIHPLRAVKREVVDTGLVIGRLNLQFTYDTSRKIPRVPERLAGSGGSIEGGPLGSLLWSSNLHRSVGYQEVSQGIGLPVPTVVDRGNGVIRTWTSTNQAPPVAEPGNADRWIPLPAGGSAYVDSTRNVMETYTAKGLPATMTWTDGTRVDFSYDTTGRLAQVSDNAGRSLSFGYAAAGADQGTFLNTITDASGAVTSLSYDSRGNLVAIGWPDGRTRRFVYGIRTLPWAMTGIEDERGVRYASFGYDSEGRAISSEHAGGTQRFSVSYTVPPSIQVTEQTDGNYVLQTSTWNAPQGVVVTQPDGSTSTWGVMSLNGKNHLTGQSQQAGAGCAASMSGQSYDANGNLASRDDFNGTRSCYVSDSTRNLQITEVAGLSQSQVCGTVTAANATLPAGARKTSTQWHPDWSLQTKQAAPGQITTWVYNGQPDPFAGNATASCAPSTATLPDGKPIAVLCKQVEQATTDGDGHLGFSAGLQAGPHTRVRTWTYNERGQVLTAKGTRNSDTTTYTYYATTDANHTVGDLATMTDAAGKTTTYDKYDKLGQLLQSTDPDGVVTLRTYDARQRLLTSTVGTETTTYTYDPVGQLTQVTQPDGRWIGYEYDDAHRQTAVKDSRGNRIDYQLDNAGKQIGQTVKDPGGSLRRDMARVMDALGRVQQGTGRE